MKKILTIALILSFCSWGLYGQSDWTAKAPFGGGARAATVGFSIGHYGFIGCGTTIPTWNVAGDSADFWRWDAHTNIWTRIAKYPGGPMELGIGFTIEGKGYVCFGWNGAGITNLYRYDTISNAWSTMATFPGSGRYDVADFVIGHKVYIIAGSTGGPPYLSDVWVYDAHQNSWKQLNNFPESNVEGAVAFSIGKHGYAGNGFNNPGCYSTMYEYDTASDTWTKITPIPYAYGISDNSVNCTIGSKGYIFNGGDCSTPGIQTGWVYDTNTKGWCAFTDLGKSKISTAFTTAFVINNHIYMGTGYDTNYHNLGDFLEYTPNSKFTVSDTVSCTADTAHFTASTNYVSPSWSWSFPGGSPSTSNLQNPNIIYPNPGTYSVTLIVSACGGIDTVSRTITIKSNLLPGVTIKGKLSICPGVRDTLIASGGGTYLWSNGATTSSIIISPIASATYTVKVTKGCSTDTSISVTVNPIPHVYITGNDTVCAGNSTTLSATGGGTYKWSNGATSANIIVSPNITSIYSVTVTNNNGCSNDTSVKVVVTPLPSVTFAGKTDICLGDPTTLYASGGGTYKWSNGATTTAITVTPHNNAVYLLTVNANGCSKDTSVLVNVSTLTASITGPLTICKGDSVTLYSSGGGTYKWSTGSSTSSILVYPPSTTTYSVIITNGPCVKDTGVTVTVKDCNTSGIENYHDASSLITIYPNPNNGVFTIQSSVVSGKLLVEVYNVLGEKVYSQFIVNSSSFIVNLSKQPQGIYFYRVITGTGLNSGEMIGEGKVLVQK